MVSNDDDDDAPYPVVKNTKFLGVYLDCDLGRSESVAAKVCRDICLLRNLATKVSLSTRKTAYYALIARY